MKYTEENIIGVRFLHKKDTTFVFEIEEQGCFWTGHNGEIVHSAYDKRNMVDFLNRGDWNAIEANKDVTNNNYEIF